MRPAIVAVLFLATSALQACGRGAPEAEAGAAASDSPASAELAPAREGSGASEPFSPVADVQELMARVLDPASDVFWDAVGWIDDANGTTYIHPESDEEWDAVVNAAFVLAESGNLLMMEGRRIDDGAWMGMSQSMVDVGRRAIAIAEARDEQGVFDVGAEVYAVCTNCHAAYAVETLPPNAAGN